MTVECSVEKTELVNDRGVEVPGVEVTCGECGHCVTSFGQTENSTRRCFALLREQCPNGEENFYKEG